MLVWPVFSNNSSIVFSQCKVLHPIIWGSKQTIRKCSALKFEIVNLVGPVTAWKGTGWCGCFRVMRIVVGLLEFPPSRLNRVVVDAISYTVDWSISTWWTSHPFFSSYVSSVDFNHLPSWIVAWHTIGYLPWSNLVEHWISKNGGALWYVEAWYYTRPVVHFIRAGAVIIHRKWGHVGFFFGSWCCTFRGYYKQHGRFLHHKESSVVGQVLVDFVEVWILAKDAIASCRYHRVEISRNGGNFCSTSQSCKHCTPRDHANCSHCGRMMK